MFGKRYQIIEEIGSTDSGKVFKAFDLFRQEMVALKLLVRREPEFTDRFKAEFILLKKLHHPNIIKAFDFGFTDARAPYFVMEYVPAVKWEELARPSNHSGLYQILVQILSALDFLHLKRIIHGDIKPSNILITTCPDSRLIIKFTDFGFAEYEKAKESSHWKGTLPYLAPEIIRGEKPTSQSDLYSLGILIYESLFGKPLFDEENLMDLARSHLEREVIMPEEPPIPAELRNLILRLLEKDPTDRFFSARDVLDEVRRMLDLRLERPDTALAKSLVNSMDFVRRDKEFTLLRETLTQCGRKGNKFVLIKGESGMGKTRLMEEFVSRTQVEGFGAVNISLKDNKTLKVFQDNPFQFLEINSCPSACIFQHVELGDDSFFEFLSDFACQTQDKRVLVCLTLNSHLPYPEQNQRVLEIEKKIRSTSGDPLILIRLARLSVTETERMLCSMFGWREGAEKIAEAIHQETGGNPLLICQFVESLVEQGMIRREKDRWSIKTEGIEKSRIPQSVRDELEKRLACLQPQSKELLACASIWGLEIEFVPLVQLTGFNSTSTLSCLHDIVSHGLMEELSTIDKNRFRFVNNLFRRFAYEQVDPEKRKALHQKAGETLEKDMGLHEETCIYDLANHFYQAGDAKRAFRYSLLAAERAEGKGHHFQVILHYTHALELYDEIPDLSLRSKESILESLADQFDLSGEPEKSLKLYREVVQISDSRASDHQTASICRKMGRIYEKMGEHDRAAEFFEKSLAKFYASESLKECATTLVDLGWVYARQSDYELAKNQFEKAMAILKKGETSKEMGSALSGLGIIHWALGDHAQASWYHHESLKVFKEIRDLRKIADCYGNLGIVARRRGQLKEAIEYFGECLDLQKTLQDQYRLSISYNNLGLTHFDLNQWDEALECLEKACEFLEKTSDLVDLGFCYNNLGLIYLRKGESRRAREYFNLAIVQFQATHHKSGLALVYYNLGDLYVNREEFGQALAYLNKSLRIRKELGEEAGIADCLVLMARVSLQQSAFEQAHQNLLQAQGYYQKQGNRKAEAEVLLSMAELCIKTKASAQTEARLGQAQELLRQLDNKLLQGIFQRVLACFMKEMGNLIDSFIYLSDSAKIFKELQARLELGRTYLELGKIKLELKRYKEAKGFLMEALNIFQREEIEPKKEEVKTLLEQIKDLKIMENEKVTTFYQLADLLNNIWDTDELLTKSLELAIQLLNAERGAIIFYSEKDKSFEVRVSHGIELETSRDAITISRQVLRDVVRSDAPLIVEDARKDPRFAKSQSVIMYNILSILCVPLKTKNRLIGTVYLDHRSLPTIFSPEDVDFLNAFANLIATAIEKSELYVKANEEIFQLKEVLHRTYEYPGIIGKSLTMQEVFNMVEKVANSKTGVLILGENGTGKEVVANLIHERSQRKDGPFIKVNCAALPETLLESELFGIEEKTATGVGSRKGKFELANGGTLFLDEIGDMSLSVQAKVLRAIEEKEFERVGGQRPIKVDVRIISATNMDLHKKIEEGSFRKDLYFRLNPIVMTIPPLRERKEDIPFLIDYFVKNFSRETNKPPIKLTKRIINALKDYAWPGNVRELEHLIESATLLSEDGGFPEKLLPKEVRKAKSMISLDKYGKLQEVLNWVEKKKILLTLDKNGWNQSRAAQELGISEPTLRRRMKEHNTKRTVKIRSS